MLMRVFSRNVKSHFSCPGLFFLFTPKKIGAQQHRRKSSTGWYIKKRVRKERSWHGLTMDIENISVANWYRPGATVHDGPANLHIEVGEHFQAMSDILTGISDRGPVGHKSQMGVPMLACQRSKLM